MMDERGQMVGNPVPVTIGTVVIIGLLIFHEVTKQTAITYEGVIPILVVIAVFGFLVIVHGVVGPRFNTGENE